MLYMGNIWFSQVPLDKVIVHILFVGLKIEKGRLTDLVGFSEPRV